MKILVTGTLGYDYIMVYPGRFADRIMKDKIHQISLSFLVDSLRKNFGGTSGNIAYTLRLLGNNPTIVACGGNDFSLYRAFMKEKKMDASGISLEKSVPTGSYFVVTDLDDNQIGSFYVGAGKNNKRLSLKTFIKKSHDCFTVISANDPKAINKYVRECIALTSPYMYDPAFQIGQMGVSDLRFGISHAAIFIGNDYEVALAEKRLGISHTELLSLVPLVVTTLGAKGSRVEKGKEVHEIKPVKAKKVVDPTGAGDAYRGGFLTGYLSGKDLATCGQMGSLSAVYTVEKYGTVTHSYSKAQFQKRFYMAYKKKVTW